MAKLLLISEETMHGNDNRQIGDVVGIFDDAHIFSESEKAVFDIIQVPQSKLILDIQRPKTLFIYKAKTLEWTLEAPEEQEAWKDAEGNICEIKTKPTFFTRWENGQLYENFSRFPENTTISIPKAAVK